MAKFMENQNVENGLPSINFTSLITVKDNVVSLNFKVLIFKMLFFLTVVSYIILIDNSSCMKHSKVFLKVW